MKEELNALKNEVEALNRKLAELSEDEIKLVMGGSGTPSKSHRELEEEQESLIANKLSVNWGTPLDE